MARQVVLIGLQLLSLAAAVALAAPRGDSQRENWSEFEGGAQEGALGTEAALEQSGGGGGAEQLGELGPQNILSGLYAVAGGKRDEKKEASNGGGGGNGAANEKAYGAGAGEKKVGPTAIDIFGMAKNPGQALKLLFSPLEFVGAIAKHFQLDHNKFLELVGKPLVFGLDALLTPLVVTLKIIEKVFLPDACLLRFVCKLSHSLHFFKEPLLKLHMFHEKSGSSILRAFSEGLAKEDCELKFSGCGASGQSLKLRKEYDVKEGVSAA